MADYQTEVLADNPVAYFQLSEPSGTNANDLGSANNDGTYVNTPTLGVTGAITGVASNTAATFTAASSEFMETADNAAYDAIVDTFTLEAWVKTTGTTALSIVSLGQGGPLIRIGDGATTGGSVGGRERGLWRIVPYSSGLRPRSDRSHGGQCGDPVARGSTPFAVAG